MQYFLQRLKEPSTMAAAGVLATTFGADPSKVATVQGALTALLCLFGMFMPEKK